MYSAGISMSFFSDNCNRNTMSIRLVTVMLSVFFNEIVVDTANPWVN